MERAIQNYCTPPGVSVTRARDANTTFQPTAREADQAKIGHKNYPYQE